MANPEHLEILKQGIVQWNNWREEHPDVSPDLVSADLNGAALRQTNLSAADLYNANLGGADLSGADLNGVNLGGADLSGANLSGTDLYWAALREADLSGRNSGRRTSPRLGLGERSSLTSI